jgi:hypothetical protein
MSFLKSELPTKLKLSGADYFHVVLDTHAAHHNSGGNVVRMAFCLEQNLSKETLREKLSGISVIHWLCNISLVKGNFFRAPYWLYKDEGREIAIFEHSSGRPDEIPHAIFHRDIPLNAERFIEADLIHGPGNKTILLFSWNHILLDGRGSGMLTDYIDDPKPSILVSAFFPKERNNESWFSGMKNMFQVKAFLESTTKGRKIASVAPENSEEGEFRFHLVRFSHEQTKQIEKHAKESGNRFGVNAFLISACSIAVGKVLESKGRKGDLWVPVPYDGRKRGAFGPVISNNVSSVFYTIPSEKLKDVNACVAHVNGQLAEQLKLEMPKKYSALQEMMRYLPSDLYYKLVNRPGEGALASFLYTATGEGIGDMKTFFGIPVSDMVIYSPQTFPPGLTFLFLRFNDTIKVNISYSSSSLSETELQLLEKELILILLKQ